jgi:hypothetical protein
MAKLTVRNWRGGRRGVLNEPVRAGLSCTISVMGHRLSTMADVRIGRGRTRGFGRALIFLMMGAVSGVAAVVACSSPAAHGEHSVTQTITDQGGVLALDDLVLEIQPGALSGSTAITITRTPDVAPPGYEASSALYRFAPEGLVFAKSATVTMNAVAGASGTSIIWSAGADFVPLETATGSGRARASVSHFSRGFLGTPTCDHAASCVVQARCTYFSARCSSGGAKEERHDCECAGANWECVDHETSCPRMDGGAPDADAPDGSAAGPGKRCGSCATSFTVSSNLAVPSTSAGYAQRGPAVAFDGTNYLLLWSEGPSPGSNWVVKAARISAAGTVLDNPPLILSGAAGSMPPYGSTAPRATFNGTDFVVVWSTGPYGGGSGISGVRVSPAGTLRDGSAFTLPGTADCYTPDVACGAGQCLVGWNNEGSNQIKASRVDPSSTVLDNPPLLVATPSQSPGLRPRIQFDGTDYRVAWGDTLADGGVYLRSVSTTGQISSTSTVAGPPSLWVDHASDGEEHLLVWTPRPDGVTTTVGLFGRVAKDGGVLDPGGRRFSNAGSNAATPSVAFDGREYLTVWHGQRRDDLGVTNHLFGVQICCGAVGSPFTVAGGTSNTEAFVPAIASDSKGTSLVAYELCGGSIDCRVHARLVSGQ